MKITGHDINQVYFELVKSTMHGGNDLKFSNNVGSGLVRELRPTLISFPMNGYRFMDLRKDFNLAFAYAEVLTILAKSDNDHILKHYNKNISTYADENGVFNAPYGSRIRSSWGDQLETVLNKLKNNDKTRQAVIQIWDPVKDNEDSHKDYACNNLCYLLVRNKTLEWTQVIRSNDLIWGLPYNIVQFGSLMQIMASMLGIDCGNYHHFCNSSHIYDKHFTEANELISNGLYENDPQSHPIKRISKKFKVNNLSELEEIINFLLGVEEWSREGGSAPADLTREWIIKSDNAFFDLGVVLVVFNMMKHNKLDNASQWVELLLDGSYEKRWLQGKLNKKLG